jgi:hypothetical protein
MNNPYQPRACLQCGKHLPRWVGGKQISAGKRFCCEACTVYFRRHSAKKLAVRAVGENTKKKSSLLAFVEPVLATEPFFKERRCPACKQTFLTDTIAQFCSARCQQYVPPDEPEGQWFIVAGPAEPCGRCNEPTVPNLPRYRVEGRLICGHCYKERGARRSPQLCSGMTLPNVGFEVRRTIAQREGIAEQFDWTEVISTDGLETKVSHLSQSVLTLQMPMKRAA